MEEVRYSFMIMSVGMRVRRIRLPRTLRQPALKPRVRRRNRSGSNWECMRLMDRESIGLCIAGCIDNF
jgi:hypothetical protein